MKVFLPVSARKLVLWFCEFCLEHGLRMPIEAFFHQNSNCSASVYTKINSNIGTIYYWYFLVYILNSFIHYSLIINPFLVLKLAVLTVLILILIPIIFHLLRKRFFPKLSTFLSFCFLVMSISRSQLFL